MYRSVSSLSSSSSSSGPRPRYFSSRVGTPFGYLSAHGHISSERAVSEKRGEEEINFENYWQLILRKIKVGVEKRVEGTVEYGYLRITFVQQQISFRNLSDANTYQ